MKQGRLRWLLAGCLLAEAVLGSSNARAAAKGRAPPDVAAIQEASRPDPPDPYISSRSVLHFLHAMLARSAGDSATAIAQLKLATIYDPQHAYPAYMLAEEYFQLEQLGSAEQAVHDALAIQSNHEPSLLLLGRIYLQRGRVEDSLDAFTRASAANPLDPDPYHWIVDADLSQGDTEKALALAERIDGLAATTPDTGVVRRLQATAAAATTRVAEIVLAQGQIDEAEELYRRAAAEEPGRASHLITLARFYERQSRLRDAADALMTALAVNGADPQLAVEAAGLYLRVGDRRAAISCAEALSTLAIGTDSELRRSADAMVAIGDALMGEQAPEQAQRAFALAAATQTGWSVPIYREAEAMERRGALAEAAAKFRRIPGGDPLCVPAQARAALCEYRRGARTQATTMLRSLERAFPDTPDVVVALAMTMDSDGNPKGAAKLLEGMPAGKVTPAVARTLFRIAGSIDHQVEALRVLQVAVARFPADADLSFDLVKAFEAAGKHDAAISEARRLTERAPNMGVVLDFLARALIEQGGPALDEAEDYARRAILAWPDRGRYVETLAMVQEAKGSAEAVYSWRRAADMLPGQADTELRLAAAEAKVGHADEARSAFQRAVSLAESARDKATAERARRGLTGLQTAARAPAP